MEASVHLFRNWAMTGGIRANVDQRTLTLLACIFLRTHNCQKLFLKILFFASSLFT
jgi:hypothetical protein